MKVLIIGCGYLGTAAAKHLKALGHTLFVTTTSKKRYDELMSLADECIVVDSCDRENLLPYLEQSDAIVLTLAAKDGNVDTYRSTYLDTAEYLSQHLNPRVKQIIYTSSTSVYGDAKGEFVDEETHIGQKTALSEILLQTEETLLNLAIDGRIVCLLRLGELYGPGREWIRKLEMIKSSRAQASAQTFVNCTHVEDGARAIAFALQHKLSGIYNVCSPAHPLRRELYDLLCKRYDYPAISWVDAGPSPRGNKRVNSQKLCKTGFDFYYKDIAL